MISVITPTHDVSYLEEAFDSLLAQTYTDWEWVLIPNNGARIPTRITEDHRVVVIPFESNIVGALKNHGFSQGSGDYLVELDHDDQLMPDALAEIASHTEDFVWSNCVEVDDRDGKWEPRFYSPDFGWEYRPVQVDGHHLLEARTPDPEYPSNWSRIWFAPNHVRAWRRDFYLKIGGHDSSMKICDDADLLCRTFLSGSWAHIDKPLYLQRIHGKNSWLKYNAEIQENLWHVHDRYFLGMAESWADSKSLRKVDLGGAIDCPPGYESYDRHHADIVGDLEGPWMLEDDSVGVLRAWDTLEHLADPIHSMNEAWRVLDHGGVFDIWVPSTRGEGAWCDPTHVSFWNKRSFRYYTEPGMRRYLEPECQAKFQVVKVEDVNRWDEGIPYVHAQLLAVKDPNSRIHGEMLWT